MKYSYPISPSSNLIRIYRYVKNHLNAIQKNVDAVKKIVLPTLFSTPQAQDIVSSLGNHSAFIKDNELYLLVYGTLYLKVEISDICLMPTNILIFHGERDMSIDIRNGKIIDKGILFTFKELDDALAKY